MVLTAILTAISGVLGLFATVHGHANSLQIRDFEHQRISMDTLPMSGGRRALGPNLVHPATDDLVPGVEARRAWG
jgi:hypothetical protein